MNQKNTKVTRMLAIVLALGSAITVYATCTYIQTMSAPVCSTSEQCANYSTPVGVTCADIYLDTSGTPGPSSTNTVTVTTYSGGTCSEFQTGFSYCTGGTQTGVSTNTIVNHYCQGCRPPGGGA